MNEISMEIIHVSAECYPVAKVGGLGDVWERFLSTRSRKAISPKW